MRVTRTFRPYGALHRLVVVGIVAVSTLAFSLPRTLQGQQPIVFVHGGFSDGSTWAQTAQRLAQEYNVTTTHPNLPSTQTFETQGQSLISQSSSLPGNTIAFGHSNGGLVSRQANAAMRSWSGIGTIGTPHTGVPLAQNILNGQVVEEARYLINSISLPFAYYSTFYPDEWAWQIAGRIGNWGVSMGLSFLGALANQGFVWSNPIVADVAPGSGFLNNINSAANLNREASALPNRVSITSTVPTSYALFCNAVNPDGYRSCASNISLSIAVYLTVALYYAEFVDFNDYRWQDKQANAYLWFDAAAALYHFDQDWCWLIGANNGYNCTENDGVVPTSRMPYPGGTRNFNMVGPAHLQETRDGYPVIALVLDQDFGVEPRFSNPITSVSVSGPNRVNGCQEGTWTATPTGGTTPITYVWTAEGFSQNTGTDNHFYYANTGTQSSIFVRVTATDSQGAAATSAIFKTNVTLPGSC